MEFSQVSSSGETDVYSSVVETENKFELTGKFA